jgi:hypothetical protein
MCQNHINVDIKHTEFGLNSRGSRCGSVCGHVESLQSNFGDYRKCPSNFQSYLIVKGDPCSEEILSKDKGHPRTGHEDPEGEERCSSTLYLTSALDGVGGKRHASAAIPLRKRPGAHCVGGWVGPRAGLDGCGKSRPHRDSIPGPSSP